MKTIFYYLISLIIILLTPLIWLALIYRTIKGKEDKSRIFEKFGFSKIPNQKSPVIWVHGASVGELNSSLEFIELMHKAYPKFYFLITTGTKTSADLATKKLSNKSYATHRYAPLDNPIWVKRFLNQWSPKICFRIDTEIWPITLYELESRKIPHYIINGRMMEKSLKSYTKFSFIRSFLNGSFSGCYAKDEEDKKRFIKFGIKNTKCFGNLKFDTPKLKFDEKNLIEFQKKLKGKIVINFAQNSEYEEEMVINLYKELVKRYKNLVFTVIPRNSKRGDEFAKKIKTEGINLCQESKFDTLTSDTQIYLYDKMGDIGAFFALTKHCVLGRSFGGNFYGSNPIEPLQFNNIIFTGPHTKAFESIFQDLVKSDSVILCNDEKDLLKKLENILSGKINEEKITENGKKYLLKNKEVGIKILKDLTPILKEIK